MATYLKIKPLGYFGSRRQTYYFTNPRYGGLGVCISLDSYTSDNLYTVKYESKYGLTETRITRYPYQQLNNPRYSFLQRRYIKSVTNFISRE